MTAEAPQEPVADSRRFRKLFTSIAMTMFLGVLDQTIVVAALPEIAESLGHANQLPWIVVSYLIATTITAPVYGRMGDILGRRRLLLLALCIFIAGSLISALAPNVWTLIVGRLVQGIGGGGLLTLSHALIGEAIPARERAKYQGYLAVVIVSANTLGPVIGGNMAEYIGWRSIFYMNLPLGILAFALALRLEARAGTGERGRFDFPGLLLFVIFVTSSLLALYQLQQPVPARLMLAGLGLVIPIALLLFLRQQTRAPNPLIPPRVISNPSVWRADAMAAFHGAALVSLLTFIPLYLRTVHGLSPAEIGGALVPMTIGIGTGAAITGRLVNRTGRTAIFPAATAPATCGLLLVLSLSAGSLSLYQIAALLFAITLTMGATMPVVQVTVQVAAGPANLGAAAGTVQLSRSLGAGVGTATVGMVLFSALGYGHPDAVAAFGTLIEHGDAAAQEIDAGLQAVIAASFAFAFLAVALFAAIVAWMAWTMPLRRI
ncbi:MFS transporter [Pseudochelatococcus sp. B33]